MSKHEEPKAIVPVIKCGECGVTFASRSEEERRRWAERHMRNHYGSRQA
jgi:hypothetical protein